MEMFDNEPNRRAAIGKIIHLARVQDVPELAKKSNTLVNDSEPWKLT